MESNQTQIDPAPYQDPYGVMIDLWFMENELLAKMGQQQIPWPFGKITISGNKK